MPLLPKRSSRLKLSIRRLGQMDSIPHWAPVGGGGFVTEDELRWIEQELGISLPEPYERLVFPFPVPYLRGNADSELWDDPELLVARNRELRILTQNTARGRPTGNSSATRLPHVVMRSICGTRPGIDHRDLLRRGCVWSALRVLWVIGSNAPGANMNRMAKNAMRQ